MAELSLWLDSYDDIYSDFDSRHYLKRRISEDFIDELKASMKYKTEHPDTLLLLLPAQLRNEAVEESIAFSFKKQIKERVDALDQKARIRWNRGMSLLIAGVLTMIVESIVFYKVSPGYFTILLRIVMEPAGWFMIWNGLDFLLYEYRSIVRGNSFYREVVAMTIHFKDE